MSHLLQYLSIDTKARALTVMDISWGPCQIFPAYENKLTVHHS